MPKLLTTPLPFAEALDRLRDKRVLPTALSSAELREELAAEVRMRSLFSARCTKAAILQEYQDKLEELLNGETNVATARMEIQQLFDALHYTPEFGFPGDEGADIPPAERGTLRDLSSNTRVDLVLQTNMRQCANYGFWKQGQSDFALFAYPAYELVRIYPRVIPRGMRLRQGALEHVRGEDWPSRWDVAGGEFFGEGRMIARKDSEVWGRLGSSELFPDALDTFFPPFAFNSGFGWREIDRGEAIRLGVIDEDTEIEGQHHHLNETLVAPGSLSVEMLDDALGDLEEYRAQLDQKIAAEKAGAEASQAGKAHAPWKFNFPGESVASNSSYDPNQLRGEGLRHILQRREDEDHAMKSAFSPEETALRLVEVIARGSIANPDAHLIEIDYEGFRAVLARGKKNQNAWLLTGFEKKKEENR